MNSGDSKSILIDKNVCDVCGTCVSVCHPDCINMSERALLINNENCINCSKCINICPVRALSYEE